jgi:hypothetical protein
MFKRILCFIFGHIKHEIEWLKGIPILKFVSKDHNIQYSIDICSRCNGVFNTLTFNDGQEEYDRINKEMSIWGGE